MKTNMSKCKECGGSGTSYIDHSKKHDHPYYSDHMNAHTCDRCSGTGICERLTFYCDDERHLVCEPFSIDNLHLMAQDLGVKRCWFHNSSTFPHYDIPKRRIAEITAKCTQVTARHILDIIKSCQPQ